MINCYSKLRVSLSVFALGEGLLNVCRFLTMITLILCTRFFFTFKKCLLQFVRNSLMSLIRVWGIFWRIWRENTFSLMMLLLSIGDLYKVVYHNLQEVQVDPQIWISIEIAWKHTFIWYHGSFRITVNSKKLKNLSIIPKIGRERDNQFRTPLLREVPLVRIFKSNNSRHLKSWMR